MILNKFKKKGHIKWTFYKFKCSLLFKNNIVKVVCFILQLNNNRSNEIRNRTGVSPSNSCVLLVKESAAWRVSD